VPLEVQAEHLQLEPDPVLAEMLRSMHLIVHELNAPFEPEGGAYVATTHAHHDHDHHDHA
jgi:urease accessory protein